MRSGFFTKTEEARNSGSFKKGKAALDAVLVVVRLEQLLVGELLGVEHVGRDQEARLTHRRALEGGWVERHRRLDLPDVAVGDRVVAGASGTVVGGMGVGGMGEQLRLDLEPVGALLELLIAGFLGVGLAGKALGAQAPQRLLPLPTSLPDTF
jgi:hypothetical protein